MAYDKKFKEYTNHKGYEPKETVKDVLEYPIKAIPERGITKATCEKFGVRVSLSQQDGKTIEAIYFPYHNTKGQLVGYKKRNLLLDKSERGHFTTVGTVGVASQLFGQTVADSQNRQKKDLIYVEGEFDAMSVYQAGIESVEGTKYEGLAPFVVSLSCGTANAVEATMHNINFIKKFNNVVFAFDNDFATPAEKAKKIKRGHEAREDVANCLLREGVGMFVVDYVEPLKDPSDYLQEDKSADLAKLIQFGRRQFAAEKIVRVSDISFEELIARKPEGVYVKEFPKLMEKIHGFRTGELTLLTAPAGAGKSVVTSIVAANLVDQDKRVGMIYLEETRQETLQRIVANRLGVNYNKFKFNPLGVGKTSEQIKEAYDFIVEQDRIILLDHFGSLPISELMNKIKTMHLAEQCDFIILDHLSVVISGTELVDERKELDLVMTALAAFCAANDVGIIAVSHINRSIDYKPPKGAEEEAYWIKVNKESLRGSAALEQLSWTILGLEPEILPNRERGRVRLTVLKNRPWGLLGVADTFTMDDATWEIISAEDEDY